QDAFGDAGAATYFVLVPYRIFEQRKFLLREQDLFSVSLDTMAVRKDADRSKGEFLFCAFLTSKLYADPHQQLFEMKGLLDVVIGTGLEAKYGLVQGVFCSEKDDWSQGKILSKLTYELNSAHSRQHPVQQQQVIISRKRKVQAFLPIVRYVDSKGFFLESLLEKIGNTGLVFDYQDAHQNEL